MKVIRFFLVSFFCLSPAWACQLKTDVISLSSPISGLLKELGLFGDSHLKAISLFYPDETFKGERLGGGLFLSSKVVESFRGKRVFFDQSFELKKRLQKISNLEMVEVPTRSLDPFEASEKALTLLETSLSGCDLQIGTLKSWLLSEKEWQAQQKPLLKPVFFFLGALQEKKLPELMIVQDGPMLFWIRHKKLTTLESDLAYVRWGEKWYKGLKGDEMMIGLAEGKFSFEKVTMNRWNVKDSEALSPGIGQVRFMRRLMENFPR